MLLSAASATLTHTYHGLTWTIAEFPKTKISHGDDPQGASRFFSVVQLLVPQTSHNLCSSISKKHKLRLFPLQQQKGLGSWSAHSHSASGLCVLLMLLLLLLGLFSGKEIDRSSSIPLISSYRCHSWLWPTQRFHTAHQSSVWWLLLCSAVACCHSVHTGWFSAARLLWSCCSCSWHPHLNLSLTMAVIHRCLVLFWFLSLNILSWHINPIRLPSVIFL